MERDARVALPAAAMFAAGKGLIDVQVERRGGTTYLELVVAVPMTPAEAAAFLREFRGGAPAAAAPTPAARPPRKRRRKSA